MSHNFEYLITRPGFLKIATLVFGILSFTIGEFAHTNSKYTDYYASEVAEGNPDNVFGTEPEVYQIVVTGVFLGISTAYLILYGFIYELCESKINRILDTAIHMAGALLIFAGGCVLIYSASEIEDYNACSAPNFKPRIGSISTDECSQLFGQKVLAGAFSVINSIIYGVTAVTVFISKDEDDV